MAVVVGFTANAEGRAAIAAAQTEAQARGLRLVVVVHAPRGQQESLEGTVQEAHQLTADADVEVDIHRNDSDDLAEELLRIAAKVEPTLIVIGLRRRSVTGKLILGSNAQRILLDSPTPVLAVKSPH